MQQKLQESHSQNEEAEEEQPSASFHFQQASPNPIQHDYHEGDVVYLGAEEYEIVTIRKDSISLRNARLPLFEEVYSRTAFDEKLSTNPANDSFKSSGAESQEMATPEEKAPGSKGSSVQLSIPFSEHPAFYDKQLHERFTELSFAVGNKLLGILDKKQHYDRLDKSKNIGWYNKTDFVITAVIGGEEFRYEGRFDIGDGEGDLLAHIRDHYKYVLAPDCPYIPEWKREGEAYYKKQMETLQWGWDVFVPFLEQHTTLSPEEEAIIDEILATESDWYRSGNVALEAAAPQTNDSPDKPKTILPEKKNQQSLAPSKDTHHNFRIADDTNPAGGPKEKFRNNMTAIHLLHRLEQEKRLATTEEQEVLSRYVGWGGLSMALDKHNAAWAKEYKELSEALSPEEYRAAMESTLTAFYTPPIVIRAMYKALEHLGFSEGRILDIIVPRLIQRICAKAA